jgi:hypothetical protein
MPIPCRDGFHLRRVGATETTACPTTSLMDMKAANRWETEAIRESRDRRHARPAVSQQRETPNPGGDWRTLREASDETGIPVNTLRKWCRRESVDSYLESDGEVTLRMLEMASVEQHASAVGRDLAERPGGSPRATGDRGQAETEAESSQPPATSRQPEESRQATGDRQQAEAESESSQPPATSFQPGGSRQATGDKGQAEAESEGYQLPATSRQPEESPKATGDRGQAEEGQQPKADSPQAESELESYQPPATSFQPEGSPQAESVAIASAAPLSSPSFSSSPSGGRAERSEAEGVEQAHTEPSDPPPGLATGLPSEGGEEGPAPGTMIVPVDAWNKMLNQLGNLHEAGQQLAEARERAGKAETEAKFLRERLAEMRSSYQPPATSFRPEPSSVPPAEGRGDAERSDAGGQSSAETTSFFRYVVRGWKGRRR